MSRIATAAPEVVDSVGLAAIEDTSRPWLQREGRRGVLARSQPSHGHPSPRASQSGRRQPSLPAASDAPDRDRADGPFGCL